MVDGERHEPSVGGFGCVEKVIVYVGEAVGGNKICVCFEGGEGVFEGRYRCS